MNSEGQLRHWPYYPDSSRITITGHEHRSRMQMSTRESPKGIEGVHPLISVHRVGEPNSTSRARRACSWRSQHSKKTTWSLDSCDSFEHLRRQWKRSTMGVK